MFLFSKEIKNVWDKFDLNDDGILTMNEVETFIRMLGKKIPDGQKQRILEQLDRNHNGTIEFIEFVLAYEKGFFLNL
jgi:Ca2+-binding EF-hand superfamily protein